MSTEAAYNAIPALRWSRLRALRVSPKAFRWAVDHEDEDDDTISLRIGRAVHAALLEPAKFLTDFAIWPKTRRGKEWEKFRDEHPDHDIITETEAELVEHCVKAIQSHGPAMSILTSGAHFEHTLTWVDAATSVKCKARVDIVNGRLSDLKTSRSVAPRMFAAQVARFGYLGQLAFYTRGLNANGFEMTKPPALVAVETSAPFDVVVFRPSADDLRRADEEIDALLRRYVECVEANEWPGIAETDELDLVMPAWAFDTNEPEPVVTFGGVPLMED